MIWLKDLNDPVLKPQVFDYVKAMLAAGQPLPPPEALRDQEYECCAAPPASAYEPFGPSKDEVGDGLERLDPVCLMDVDPATARHTVTYDGRVIAFCAPACKKQFLADPAAYPSA